MGIKGYFSKDDTIRAVTKKKKVQKKDPFAKRINMVEDCNKCKLEKNSKRNPKIKEHGNFKKKALIWTGYPGDKEDRYGYHLHNKSSAGELIGEVLYKQGVDIVEDCLVTGSVDCMIPDDRKKREPTKKEMLCCYPRREKILRDRKPEVILLLGNNAIDSFYGCHPQRNFFKLKEGSLRGKAIPNQALNAWVVHSYHPNYITQGNSDKKHTFERDIRVFTNLVGKGRPNIDVSGSDKKILLTKYQDIVDFLKDTLKGKRIFSFDYESSSYRYHEGIHSIYMVSVAFLGKSKKYPSDYTYVFPFEKTDSNGNPYLSKGELKTVNELWRKVMQSNNGKIAQNIKHEQLATKHMFGVDVKNFIWDTMLGERVQDESKGISGLKNQTYLNYGVEDYSRSVDGYLKAGPKKKNRFDELDIETTSTYCAKDSYFTLRRYSHQKRMVKSKGLMDAYTLLHEGTLSFADMETSGIRLNMDYLEELDKGWTTDFNERKLAIQESDVARKYKNKTGKNLDFNKETTRADLKIILFDILGLEKTNKIDQAYLTSHIGEVPWISDELMMRKLVKRLGFINNFYRYEVNGYLYPSFLLDIARTYRSSSKEPNFQNIIKRDKGGLLEDDLGGAIIRKVIIPRKGHLLFEVDYGGMEFRIIACWSKDENAIQFILDDYDIHGYWCEKVFGIKKKDVDKSLFGNLRFGTKNGFIFANFYGSYYKNTAKDTWEYLFEYYPDNDFYPELSYDKRYARWEDHIHGCEEDFWKMFGGVRKKQLGAVEEYKRKGLINQIGWGFQRHGYLSRNEIFNTHIQGPAFQCLLWSINRLFEEKRKHNWETVIPGQIHDAIFFDMHPSEMKTIKSLTTEIMTERIRKDQDWIITPLLAEWEYGRNWYDMKGLK